MGEEGRTEAPQEWRCHGSLRGACRPLTSSQLCVQTGFDSRPDRPRVPHSCSYLKVEQAFFLPSSLLQMCRQKQEPILISSKVAKSDLTCHLFLENFYLQGIIKKILLLSTETLRLGSQWWVGFAWDLGCGHGCILSPTHRYAQLSTGGLFKPFF